MASENAFRKKLPITACSNKSSVKRHFNRRKSFKFPALGSKLEDCIHFYTFYNSYKCNCTNEMKINVNGWKFMKMKVSSLLPWKPYLLCASSTLMVYSELSQKTGFHSVTNRHCAYIIYRVKTCFKKKTCYLKSASVLCTHMSGRVAKSREVNP